LLVLFKGSGAADFSTSGGRLPAADTRLFIANAARLLKSRGNTDAAEMVQTLPFEIINSDNFFGDDFNILFAVVPLETYESLRKLIDTLSGKFIFKLIAETLSEIGLYIRFIAAELKLESALILSTEDQGRLLKEFEINKLVYNYIGVQQGYLADFSYRTHHDFYINLGLDINPYDYTGTTRERFITILSESDPKVQAKIIEGILIRFPVGSSELRTADRAREIQGWMMRLQGTSPVSPPQPSITSDVVERALRDAEALIQSQGATSAVDRAHTAFHGFLRAVCEAASIPLSKDSSVTEILKVIREQHPAFAIIGTRSEDIKRILRSMAAIVDALSTVRNRASVAHPNEELLDAPEAMLVINTVRTLLHYIDSKLD
jgi:hypothetical protein